jgi:hypothetical protein
MGEATKKTAPSPVSPRGQRPTSVSSEMRRVFQSLKKMDPKAQIELMLAAGLTTPARAAKAIKRLEKSDSKSPRRKPV